MSSNGRSNERATLSRLSGRCWDVRPLPARSGVRLANVQVVQRPPQQTAYPRARLLILNPAAGYPLSTPELKALRRLL